MTPTEREWLTPMDLARHMQVSHDTILRSIKAGRIRAVKLGPRTYRVHTDELIRLRHAADHKRAVQVVRRARRFQLGQTVDYLA